MTFMERARVFYQRGDVVRAAFVLAEGVKRDPSQEDALNWFLQIYVEEVEGPGLEQELIRVLERQADGVQLLDGVREEMERRGQHDRMAFLARVDGLRKRAAEARLETSAVPAEEPDEADLDGIDPALAERVQRRRRRGPAQASAPSATGPVTAASADTAEDDLPLPEVRRRTRRRRAPGEEATVSAAQGVLQLDGANRTPRDAWRGFKGVAAHLDPETVPPAAVTAETARVAAEVPPSRRTADSADKPASSTAPPRGVGTPHRPMPAVPPRRITERTAIPLVAPDLDEDEDDVAAPPARRARPSVDQLLALEHEDSWTFGEAATAEVELGAISDAPPLLARSRRRRVRRMPAVSMEPAGEAVRTVGRGLAWIVRGKRGLSLLALVGVLGATAAGYRACSGLVAGQIAEANESLARADGPGLERALALYTELAGDDAGELSERRDFVRALMAVELGRPLEGPEPDPQPGTVWGAAALALARLAEGNLALARPEADSAAETWPEEWVAHWTKGRVAAAEAAWDRAEEAYRRARELDETAVLPVLGLIDLGLRAGRDERVEDAMVALERLNPEHPDLAVVRGLLRFGLDPLDTRPAAPRLEVPQDVEHGLSLHGQEWLAYLRAREALSAWQLDDVAQALIGLRRAQSGPLGVRVNLLEAALAARRYRLEDAMAALDRAMTAAPDGSPAEGLARHLRATIATDLGRPELALEALGASQDEPLLRARLLIEAAREDDALTLLSALIERPDTQAPALRLVVDYHLRRGVADRARSRASGLRAAGDQAYAAARLAAADSDWSTVRDQAESALRENPNDLDSLQLWARATAELGQAERALERLDERAARSLLVGTFDEMRLEVLLASGRAPRETLAEFVGLLSTSQPAGMSRLAVLAHAYEGIGDLERAAEAAQQVLAGEPNNRAMHALLGRVYHTTGEAEESTRHLRAYLALAPATETTDWARAILGDAAPAAVTATP